MPPKEIDELRRKLDATDIKGKKAVPFKGLPVMEKAFFPGGNGLFLGSRAEVPVGGTLVLGSNFGCVADFIRKDGSVVRRDETYSSDTWKGIYRMFAPRTEINLDRCFFTNAWPFLHEGESNETKELIPLWLGDDILMKKCVHIFQETLSVVEPRLIVALGTGSSAFVGRLWSKDLGAWADGSVASMDSKPIAEINFGGGIICTAITHPSHSNSWRRRAPYQHTEGEISLLVEAAFQSRLGAGKGR